MRPGKTYKKIIAMLTIKKIILPAFINRGCVIKEDISRQMKDSLLIVQYKLYRDLYKKRGADCKDSAPFLIRTL